MNKSSNRKTIGLILENVWTDFAEEFIGNVVSGVRLRKDLDLVVVAGKFDGYKDENPNHHLHRLVYNSTYQLSDDCHFDGLIICLGSMAKLEDEDTNRRMFDKIKHVPMVFAVSEAEDHVTVNYDNEPGIREAVECLVNVHGFSKFCMMGGRVDNLDSRRRRKIYEDCLKEYGLDFTDDNYQMTDMSFNCKKEAAELLDRNPGVQAIFCVNDSVALGLFAVMQERGLEPGKDIMVFGFDNTKMAGRMIPTLTSIGADDTTLGRRALELLIALMSGEKVSSERISTRLYGRESFPYEMYEYTRQEMMNVDSAFIYRMFDDCFYRYRYEYIDRESVNLKRLFWEFISRLLTALKNRYISREEFREICELIDIFFENGAMEYTDAKKFLECVDKFQSSIIVSQSMTNASAGVYFSRIFTRMREDAIIAQSKTIIHDGEMLFRSRQSLQDFMIETMDYDMNDGMDNEERVVSRLKLLGLMNAVLFLFDEPVEYKEGETDIFPEWIRFRCGIKDGELFVLPKDRQTCRISEMFRRIEIPPKCQDSVVFPVICRTRIYGFLVSEINSDISSTGEFIAEQIGRIIEEGKEEKS